MSVATHDDLKELSHIDQNVFKTQNHLSTDFKENLEIQKISEQSQDDSSNPTLYALSSQNSEVR